MDCSSEFWVVTSYFNPQRYKRRLQNFRQFRKYLDMPLLAVELGYNDHFELNRNDAEIVLQKRGDAVLWQKERLLNLAVEALPERVKYVAWIDCDVAFANSCWASAVVECLQSHTLVQLFEHVVNLQRDQSHFDATEAAVSTRGIATYVASGSPEMPENVRSPLSGFAWAARRDLLFEHKIYDAMIAGGGDVGFAFAAFGEQSKLPARNFMSPSHAKHYLRWADSFHDVVRGKVGYIEGCIYHYWHGDRANRLYRERHQSLASYDFDPSVDIAIDSEGCFVWASEKIDMHEYLRNYWINRKEDG